MNKSSQRNISRRMCKAKRAHLFKSPCDAHTTALHILHPSFSSDSIGSLALILFSVLLLASCDKKQESVNAPNPASQQSAVVSPSESQSTTTQIAIPPDPPFIAEPIEKIIEEIPREYTFFEKLAQAALERTTHDVTYDGRYQKIAYPMGDVPDSIGVCTDVVIRSYRQLGIDLQQLLHEDISKHFKKYPNQSRWGLTRPDTNIDHRRVPNLRVFFSRFGSSLPVTEQAEDYLPGDLVTWKLNDSMVHIGIVAEEVSYTNPNRHLIIHNIGSGPELGDILFDYEITGHYRYSPNEEEI